MNGVLRRIVILILFIILESIEKATAEDWKSRVIYSIIIDRFFPPDNFNLTFCGNITDISCGGNFTTITNNLDYIANQGFTAISLSSVFSNLDTDIYGMNPYDFTKLNEKFGTENELRNLVSEAHKLGLLVMFEVMVNHVTFDEQNIPEIPIFNKTEYFHDKCDISSEDLINGNYDIIMKCRAGPTLDLKQENPYVRNMLINSVCNLVKNYNIDGLVINLAGFMPKWFVKRLQIQCDIYTIVNVPDNNFNILADYIGLLSNSVLNYPLLYEISQTLKFDSGFYQLSEIIESQYEKIGSDFYYMTSMITMKMHRFLDQVTHAGRIKMAIALLLFLPGIPLFYYGDEFAFNQVSPNNYLTSFNFDENNAYYKYTKKLLQLRQKYQIWNEKYAEIITTKNTLIFQRGKLILAMSLNNNLYATIKITLSERPKFSILQDIFTKQTVEIYENGEVIIPIGPNEIKIFEIIEIE